jgi:hypothetical protein
MHLYVEPMDAVVVEVSDDGRVRYESKPGVSSPEKPGVSSPEMNENEWSTPTLQERRAILYAANSEIAALNELLEALGG